MCIIAIKTQGASISDAQIRQMFRRNPDGAGFMYPKNGLVHCEKGFFSENAFIKRYRECVNDDMVAALHFRIRTTGDKSSALCHPFDVSKGGNPYKDNCDTPIAMMHNGCLPSSIWNEFSVNIHQDSDTSAYAKALSAKLNDNLPNKGLRESITDETTGSRLLFMNGQGEIVMTGEWRFNNGVFYSNDSYKKVENYWTYPSSKYEPTLWDMAAFDKKAKSKKKPEVSACNVKDQEMVDDLQIEELANAYGYFPVEGTGFVFDENGIEVSNVDELYTDGTFVYEPVVLADRSFYDFELLSDCSYRAYTEEETENFTMFN